MIAESNRIIQSLWIGGELSIMELLTLKSFIAQGHEFHLYVYSKPSTPIPNEVVLKDANEILNENFVFSYKNTNQFGHGKGSVSGFSDIFRYKLLYDKGNWWVDMDVTCLKPISITQPYFFRDHHELLAVGNVMKAPKSSELMAYCFERAIHEVDENNLDWHRPINILNDGIKKYNLEGYVNASYSNRDWWVDILDYFYTNKGFQEEWEFFHWTNENFRAYQLDKNKFKIGSSYFYLLEKLNLVDKNYSWIDKLANKMKYNSFHKLLKGYYKPF